MTDKANKVQFSSNKRRKMSVSTDALKEQKNEANSHNGSDDGNGAGNQKIALSSTNSSYYPEECVFSIDHILESIFGECDRQSLLNSRLVSHRWAVYGSKELQKTGKIVFYNFYRYYSATCKPNTCHFITNGRRSLNDLITLMNNSTKFPCTSFDFRGEIKCPASQSIAQSFFDAQGAAIKIIKFDYISTNSLKTFLLSQAPNLQELYLSEIESVEDTNSTQCSAGSETDEQQSERERRQEFLFDKTSSKPKPILKNLKTFEWAVL